MAGDAEHARSFLPDEAYQVTDTRILRKGDGTGFFLLLSETAPLADGPVQYRLSSTYLREKAEGGEVFSQEGDSGPEHARIDLPWPE